LASWGRSVWAAGAGDDATGDEGGEASGV